MKYHGDFSSLKILVASAGYTGEWTGDDDKKVCRSTDHSVLNWWPSTGTLQVQGPPEIKSTLETSLTCVLNGLSSSQLVSTLSSQPPKRVFVVHGHDEASREQLELVLHRLNLDPFVLANTSGGGLTIIEALEQEIDSTTPGNRFGIVLLTPDDRGFSQRDGFANPEPRARQNVVLEMGMLMAAFGRKRVAILRKGPVAVPSDASGIIYIPFKDHVKETVTKLCGRLNEAGFDLSPEAIVKASS